MLRTGGAAGEAVGGLHADGPDAAVADLLGDLGQHRRWSRRRPRPSSRWRVVDLGQASGGNSTSTTGPAMATTRPSLSVRSVGLGHGHGAGHSVGLEDARGREVGRIGRLASCRRPSASAPPTISMISVVMVSWRARFMMRREALDELLGVVGGGLHGPLAGGVLGRGGVEQGGVDAGLDVAGQQRLEDRRRATARTRSRRSARRRAGLASPPASSSCSSGTSGRSTTSWKPAETKRV